MAGTAYVNDFFVAFIFGIAIYDIYAATLVYILILDFHALCFQIIFNAEREGTVAVFLYKFEHRLMLRIVLKLLRVNLKVKIGIYGLVLLIFLFEAEKFNKNGIAIKKKELSH